MTTYTLVLWLMMPSGIVGSGAITMMNGGIFPSHQACDNAATQWTQVPPGAPTHGAMCLSIPAPGGIGSTGAPVLPTPPTQF